MFTPHIRHDDKCLRNIYATRQMFKSHIRHTTNVNIIPDHLADLRAQRLYNRGESPTWHRIGTPLVTHWHRSGTPLITHWYTISNSLAPQWYTISNSLAQHLHTFSNSLARISTRLVLPAHLLAQH